MGIKFHPVTHVLFDMDGLLLDTERLYETATATICEKYGSKYTHEAKLHTQGRTAKDGAVAVVKYCQLPITPEQYLNEIDGEYIKVFKNVQPMPGAERLVRHFHRNGIPQAVATSSKEKNYKRKTLDKAELFALFSHVVFGSDDHEVKIGKPAPDIFRVAASRFTQVPIDPKSILVFEDSIAGVQAGLAAGMQVVWVPDPSLDISIQDATLKIPSLLEFKPENFSLPPFQ